MFSKPRADFRVLFCIASLAVPSWAGAVKAPPVQVKILAAAKAPLAPSAIPLPPSAVPFPALQPLLPGTAPLPAPDSINGELSALRGRGFAVLAPGTLLPEVERLSILADIDRREPVWNKAGRNAAYIYHNEKELNEEQWRALPPGAPKGWGHNFGEDAQGKGGIETILEELRQRIEGLLEHERIYLQRADIRVATWDDRQPDVLYPHTDTGYLTASVALSGPGTHLFDVGGGEVREVRPAQGSVAVFSRFDREQRTGVPATIHSVPRKSRERRVVILANYMPTDPPDLSSREYEAGLRAKIRINHAVKAVRDFIARQ